MEVLDLLDPPLHSFFFCVEYFSSRFHGEYSLPLLLSYDYSELDVSVRPSSTDWWFLVTLCHIS